jgi:hypothetical protein
MADELYDYRLRIDGPLLAEQRKLLLKVLDAMRRGKPYFEESPNDEDLLEGMTALLDEIADQAHDRHGLDSLIKPESGDTEYLEKPDADNRRR